MEKRRGRPPKKKTETAAEPKAPAAKKSADLSVALSVDLSIDLTGVKTVSAVIDEGNVHLIATKIDGTRVDEFFSGDSDSFSIALKSD